MISRSFQTTCMNHGSGKHMFGVSLFGPSRQSNISTLGEQRFKYPLPWENKVSQLPHPRANKDNQIPTPCPAPPLPRRHDIDRCITLAYLTFIAGTKEATSSTTISRGRERTSLRQETERSPLYCCILISTWVNKYIKKERNNRFPNA